MAKVLVTGAAGFIGSHLCEALVRRGDSVVGYDSFDDFYDPAIKRRNVQALVGHGKFSLVEGDIRDSDAVRTALGDGVEMIVHLAARAGVRPSIEQPLLYQDVNINGTMVLLEACRGAGIEKFVFASSSSVYGNNKKVPFAESDCVDHPISPYAATKKAGELICHTYHHLYDLDITCLRFFTVYGARQRPDLAIHKFARLIEAGQPIPVFGDGSMMRDFTYIDDIIDGVLRAMDRCEGYHIYNLGESQPVTLSDLISSIEEALGKEAVIDRRPPQPGDVQRTYADVTLAGRDLGYEPSTSIRTGLARFVEWLRSDAHSWARHDGAPCSR
ncbi:MAG: GDP-mannose 4,6-dehydratase [Planctomycetes bacterium]|nr:GDP-mannose 4,6-dehydratase [Planctomycetota bacterium]